MPQRISQPISRRTLFAGIGVAAIGSLAAACSLTDEGVAVSGVSSTAAGDELQVGVYLPLTGDLATNGQDIKRGIDLYVDKANAAAKARQIVLTYRDTKGEPKTAASIAQEFAQDEQLAIAVGAFTSTATMAAVPVLVKSGIPNLSPTSSHPEYTKIGPGLFRGTPTSDLEARAGADFLVTRQGKKRVAVVYRQDDVGLMSNANFTARVEELGAEIAASLPISLETKDYRAIITQIQAAEPEAIYIYAQYTEGTVFAQQLAATGWKPLVAAGGALYSDKTLELAADAVEGWYLSPQFFNKSTRPIIKTFVADYTARYESAPQSFSAIGYDTAHILVQAIQAVPQSGTAARQPLIDALAKTDIEGVTGRLRYNGHGDLLPHEFHWLQINGGEFVEVGA